MKKPPTGQEFSESTEVFELDGLVACAKIARRESLAALLIG